MTVKTQTIGSNVLTAEELIREMTGKLSRSSIYAALANGQIPSTRIGGKYLISRARVRELLDGERDVATPHP
jgi:excisionase family DNA binding protein